MALNFQPYPIPQEPQRQSPVGVAGDKVNQALGLFLAYEQQKQQNDIAKQKQMIDMANAAADRGEDFWAQFKGMGGQVPAGMAPAAAGPGAMPGGVPGGLPNLSLPAPSALEGTLAGGQTGTDGLAAGVGATAPGAPAAPARPAISSAMDLTPEYLAEIKKKKGSKGLKEFQDTQGFLSTQAKDKAQLGQITVGNETQLRGDYQKESGNFKIVSENIQNIQSIKNRPQSQAGDISLVFSYMKLIDPASTVRESEVATAQNASNIPGRVRALYNSLISNQGKMDDAQRNDFFNTAGAIYKGWADKQAVIDEDFTGIATRSGMNPQNVILRRGVPNLTLTDNARNAPTGPTASGGGQGGTPPPPPPGMVRVKKPDGSTGTIPQANLSRALEQGYIAVNQ